MGACEQRGLERWITTVDRKSTLGHAVWPVEKSLGWFVYESRCGWHFIG